MVKPVCSYEACDAPLTACNLGKRDLEACTYWKGRVVEDTVEPEEHEPILPWAGGSLGQLDLDLVAARSSPHLIGLIGPHDAGKTTLLTVLYLLLWRGSKLDGRSFAGSYTLGGWESLANALRWQPGQPPTFPSHTSRNPDRIPGLLHLALRSEDSRLQDVLFTDAPGEWYETWAVTSSSSDAEGARWTVKRSTALALVVDSVALSGPERGRARLKIMTLVRRLGDSLCDDERPLAVVWSKSDSAVPASIREPLQDAFAAQLPRHREFSVSVYSPNAQEEPNTAPFLELFDWLLKERTPGLSEPMVKPTDPSDPFLAFRPSNA